MSKVIAQQLLHDPAWRGALHILETGFPSERSVVWQHVDLVGRVIDFDGMKTARIKQRGCRLDE